MSENILEIFNQMNNDIKFTIVSEKKKLNIKSNKINFLGCGFNSNSLIDIYDQHNILILPTYT